MTILFLLFFGIFWCSMTASRVSCLVLEAMNWTLLKFSILLSHPSLEPFSMNIVEIVIRSNLELASFGSLETIIRGSTGASRVPCALLINISSSLFSRMKEITFRDVWIRLIPSTLPIISHITPWISQLCSHLNSSKNFNRLRSSFVIFPRSMIGTKANELSRFGSASSYHPHSAGTILDGKNM